MVIKITPEIIYKLIIIAAIGWLIFSIYPTGNRLDKIEQRQEKIMVQAEQLLKANEIMINKADSLDKVKAAETRRLLVEIESLRKETSDLRRTAFSFKKAYEENRVDLPNPFIK